MFGRFIALGAIGVESLFRKRSTWVLSQPKKCPFQSEIRKSFANSSERVCEMGWKAPDRKRVLAEFEFGPVCGLELELVAGWSALQTLGRRVELSSSHELSSPVGNQPRQGGPVQAR